MNRLQIKTLFLTITFSFLLCNVTYSQDLLDSVKDNSKLVYELKDAYSAFHIYNIIVEQREQIIISSENNSDSITINFLPSYIMKCDSLNTIQFNNSKLKSYISNYLTATIQGYKIAQSKGLNSSEYNKAFEKFKAINEGYVKFLYSTFPTTRFVTMTEKQYWQANDKNSYIKSSDYVTYKSLKTTNLKGAMQLLDKISKETSNFQEYTI